MFFLHFQLDKYHNLFKIHISMNKDEKIVLYARFFPICGKFSDKKDVTRILHQK